MQHDAACEGWVVHRRGSAPQRTFRYPVWMLYADVDRLSLLPGRWLSTRRRLAPLALRPADYPRDPLSRSGDGIRDGINARLRREGLAPAQRVFLLTEPRSWGALFNPVSFYFCFTEASLVAVVAEINNTPWNEVHSYVLDAHGQQGEVAFAFPKRFHVSPFQPMDVDYRWRFRLDGDVLQVVMQLVSQGQERFFAGLYLNARPINAAALRRGALVFPLQNLHNLARIYWQALRLWLRRAPFYPHPDTSEERDSRERISHH